MHVRSRNSALWIVVHSFQVKDPKHCLLLDEAELLVGELGSVGLDNLDALELNLQKYPKSETRCGKREAFHKAQNIYRYIPNAAAQYSNDRLKTAKGKR
jgi:hypothetical protein